MENTDQLARPGRSTSNGEPPGTTGGTPVNVDPQVM
jgi:hypothetical protein